MTRAGLMRGLWLGLVIGAAAASGGAAAEEMACYVYLGTSKRFERLPYLTFDDQSGRIRFFDKQGWLPVIDGKAHAEGDFLSIYAPDVAIDEYAVMSANLDYYRHSRIFMLTWRTLTQSEVGRTKWREGFHDPDAEREWSTPEQIMHSVFGPTGVCNPIERR